jgi:ribosomal protein S6
MVILDGSLEERTVTPRWTRTCNVIRSSGGSVEKIDVWGRRRLAYEINKKTEGIYAVIDLQATPQPWPSWTAAATQRVGAADQGHPSRSALASSADAAPHRAAGNPEPSDPSGNLSLVNNRGSVR